MAKVKNYKQNTKKKNTTNIISGVAAGLIFIALVVVMIVSLIGGRKPDKVNNVNYGKIDYYVCGLYFNVDNNKAPKVDDTNPKAYFIFEEGDRFGNFNTAGGTSGVFTSMSHNVTNNSDHDLYWGNATYKFNNPVEEVNVYPIYLLKDGTYKIDTSLTTAINLEKVSHYHYGIEFENNKNKYRIDIQYNFE